MLEARVHLRRKGGTNKKILIAKKTLPTNGPIHPIISSRNKEVNVMIRDHDGERDIYTHALLEAGE